MRYNPAANRWYRIAVTSGALLAVLLLAVCYRYLESRGVFTAMKPVALACRSVSGVEGTSDIAVDAAAKTAFVAVAASTPSAQDGIYAYAFDTPGARLEKLAGTPRDFHPQALALTHPPGGDATLFTVNRRGTAYSIVVFRVTAANGAVRLEEKSSIGGRILAEPSGIAPVDGDRFYLVNRHISRTALGRWLDDVLLLPRANVLYFDGMIFREVAKRLNSPDGVTVSPDGGHLLVSEFYPRRIVSFVRNPFSGELKDAEVLPLPGGPGKLKTVADGSLIVAATPKVRAREVLRVNLQDGVPQAAVPLYAGRSGEIYVAAEAGGRLLLGAGDGLRDCRLP